MKDGLSRREFVISSVAAATAATVGLPVAGEVIDPAAGAHWESILKILPSDRNAGLPANTITTRMIKAIRMP